MIEHKYSKQDRYHYCWKTIDKENESMKKKEYFLIEWEKHWSLSCSVVPGSYFSFLSSCLLWKSGIKEIIILLE